MREGIFRITSLLSATKASGNGDPQWAAELTTHLVRINHDDWDARNLKANALRQIGFKLTNNNWRNWHIMSAQKIYGSLDNSKKWDIQAPDLVRAFPMSEIVNGLRFLLDPEKCLDVHMTMGFSFPDVDKAYGLEVRRGVAQFHSTLPEDADVVLEVDRATLMGLLLGELDVAGKTGVHPESPQEALAALFGSGDIKLTRETPADLRRFFSYFEPTSSEPIPIAVQ